MPWQVWVRAAVMTASAAVIVVVGGHAAVRAADGAGPPSAGPAPVRAASSITPVPPTVSIAPAALASTPPTGAPVTAVSPPVRTRAVLRLLDRSPGEGGTTRLALQGRLTDASGAPVVGEVALERRTSGGRWTRIVRHRTTSSDGLVILDVEQSARRGVYRLVGVQDAGHAPSVSRSLTVTRPSTPQVRAPSGR